MKKPMKAELKEILETQNWGFLQEYCPENPHDFCIDISMTIGILGQEGGEYFSAEVCSFDYFMQLKGQQKTFCKRDLIVVQKYDYQAIMGHIHHIIAMYDEPDWDSLAHQLNKHFLWEFDNYKL